MRPPDFPTKKVLVLTYWEPWSRESWRGIPISGQEFWHWEQAERIITNLPREGTNEEFFPPWPHWLQWCGNDLS